MAANLKHLLGLWRLYARMDLQWFTQDTFVCGLCIFSDLLSNIASISGILLLAIRFDGVGSLSADEVLFMLGFFTLSDGLLFMLFGGFNIANISRRIGRGQVEHMLMQPVPLWMQMLSDGLLPVSGNSGFVCGLLLTAYSMARLRLAVTPLWLLMLVLYVATRIAIQLGAGFFVGSAAFYRPAACEEISSLSNDLFTTLGKFPLSGLPAWLTGLLVTVLPVGLMAWLPSLVLLQKVQAPLTMLLPVLVGVLFLTLARTAFQKGMQYYVKHGVNRYRDMGHRN